VSYVWLLDGVPIDRFRSMGLEDTGKRAWRGKPYGNRSLFRISFASLSTSSGGYVSGLAVLPTPERRLAFQLCIDALSGQGRP
jgi:hypothetical protein